MPMAAMERSALRRLLAGQRPSNTMVFANQLGETTPRFARRSPAHRRSRCRDNCAFEFRVPEQQLNSSEISGPPIDHRSFRTSHIECVPYVAASKPIELTHEQSANTAEWKDAVTLTRGSEAKIALVLDVQP